MFRAKGAAPVAAMALEAALVVPKVEGFHVLRERQGHEEALC